MPKAKIQKRIYFDYAATTPVDSRVLKEMQPYFSDKFGNAMSLHHFGRDASDALEKSRKIIADVIKAESNEIIFTSSATESNNFALKGVALANKRKGNHIIISSVEHDCVLNSAKWLAKNGFKITFLPVDKYGLIKARDLKKAIKKNTILVSVIHANNEIGTIEPIAALGKICCQASSQKKIYFHTDAVQSFGKLPIDVNKMNIDLLTASSHKIYGPRGAGLLYIKKGTLIEPLMSGGGQEFGLRPSTTNVPAIVGFAKAAQIYQKEAEKENARLSRLRDKFIRVVLTKIPHSYLTGHPIKRLPNNASFRFSFIEGESILMMLDSYGIAVSTGSACSSHSLELSHVLSSCGIKPEDVNGSLRVSFGRQTKESDVDYLLKVLPNVIKKLREVSPFKHRPTIKTVALRH